MNVFSLFAKIGLDTKEYEKGLTESKGKFHSFADGLKSAAGKVGDVLAGVGKAAAAGIGAASTAITALSKKSLDAVANYEQLVGGVDTLFKDASQKVQDYANQAYMTAGLSANEYMEQTISFSASLIQGLEGDTEKAADLANMAIVDMSDNVNKMGTTMEAVQNAYNGLQRQNFMMLDNLKLGYQGTAAEMARLINDSGVMGSTFEATADNVKEISFDKYIEAIHKIQEEMGITGTTSKEAAGTITGSVASMKAAWQNFLTGTGSPKQFTEVLSVSIENIKKNLNQIIPRLTSGLTELVDLLAPEIPPLIEDTLPTIIDGSSKLLTGLASRLPELLTAILPSLATGVVNITVELVKVMPQIITSLKESIPIIVKTIMSKKDELLKAGKDIIKALFPKGLSGVTEIASKATEVIGDLAVKLTNPDNLSKIFNTGLDIINSIADGLLSEDSIDKFVETVPTVIKNLATAITDFITGGDDGEGGLFDAVYNIVDKICTYFDDPQNRTNFFMAAEDIILTLGDFLVENAGKIVPFIIKLAQRIAETLVSSLFDSIREIFDDEAGWMEEYLNTDTNLSYTDWAIQKHEKERTTEAESHRYVGQSGFYDYSEGMLAANEAGQFQNAAAVEAYKKYKASQNAHAAGFVADRPTWLGGHLIGEAGTEALIPLESNTQWMDIFADKLGARMGGGVVIEQVIINAPSGRAEDIQAAFLDTLDEALRNRQITQNRGVGAVAWK